MIRHGDPPYLECSSAGDRRFSALFACIRGRAGRTIENIYQGAKVFPGGVTNVDRRIAKGRTPVNVDEVRALYATLWNEYMAENPHLLSILQLSSGLSDKFGQAGHACQATELWRIRCASLRGLRILVCGGRTYGVPLLRYASTDERKADTPRWQGQRARLFAALTAVHRRVGIAEIIHGAARGADTLAGLWARSNGVACSAFPVDHVKDGPWPGAGYFRNKRMYRETHPDMVLAFPGGKGTGHMVQIARDWQCSVHEAS